MLFWTRACLCIGAVTAMAIGHMPSSVVRAGKPALAVPAAALLGDACRARPALCAAAVAGGLGVLTRPSEPAPAKPRLPRRAARQDDAVALGRRSLT